MEATPSGRMAADALPFTRRLAQLMALSSEESAILGTLQSNTRTVQRHRDIVVEGRTYSSLFIIIEGNGIRYRILHDGRRQIINVVLPGDIVGILGSFVDSILYSTKALSDMVVAVIPFTRLSVLFETNPRLIAKIFWSFSCEFTIYAEHLVDLGRRSALERVAHFLLELLVRLQAVGLSEKQSYKIPHSGADRRHPRPQYSSCKSGLAAAARGRSGRHRGSARDNNGYRSAVRIGGFRPRLPDAFRSRRDARGGKLRLAQGGVAKLSQVNFFRHRCRFKPLSDRLYERGSFRRPMPALRRRCPAPRFQPRRLERRPTIAMILPTLRCWPTRRCPARAPTSRHRGQAVCPAFPCSTAKANTCL